MIIFAQLIGSNRQEIRVDNGAKVWYDSCGVISCISEQEARSGVFFTSIQVGELIQLVASTFECSPSSIQLVHKGTTLNIGDAKDSLSLTDGGELAVGFM